MNHLPLTSGVLRGIFRGLALIGSEIQGNCIKLVLLKTIIHLDIKFLWGFIVLLKTFYFQTNLMMHVLN